MKVDARVTGAREVAKKIRKMQDAVSQTSARSEMKTIHAEGAAQVARDATGLAPRRSGTLAASVRSSGTVRDGVIRAGRSSVPYAGPIHFGWAARNIRPQPFLYDALDGRRDEVIELFERSIRDLVRKYGLN